VNVKQGDIIWVELGTPRGSEPAYRHPCVVIQNNVFNQSKINTIVVCTLTSNLKRANAPGNVLLRKGEGGLKKDSVVNISQMITINKTDLVEKIGSLSPTRISEVIDGVLLLIKPREI
jgi:mRNA interferase MazF